MRLATTLATALLAALLVTPPAGDADAHSPRRQLDAHSHGEGRLAIAIDGPKLQLELEAPAHDIIGFEHKPRNARQRKALADATARLENLEEVVRLPAEAGCTLESAKVETTGALAGKPHDHKHGDGKTAKAEGGKDDTKKAEAKKADGHAHDHDHDHSELRVTYAINCQTPANLRTLAFEYFKSFKGAEKLIVTVIGPKGQSQHTVTRKKPVLDLAGIT